MTDIGDYDFTLQDSWGKGLPLTDSMMAIIEGGVGAMAIMAVIKDLLEEVMR